MNIFIFFNLSVSNLKTLTHALFNSCTFNSFEKRGILFKVLIRLEREKFQKETLRKE